VREPGRATRPDILAGMRTLLPVAAAGIALLLVACGQKGPLVLPDRDTSGVVIRAPAPASTAPAAPAPAPAPTPAPPTAPPVTPGTDTAATPSGTGAPTAPGTPSPRAPDPTERRP